MQRRRSSAHTFEDRIAAEKARLEAQIAKLKPGPQMDGLLKKISQLETAAQHKRVADLAGASTAKISLEEGRLSRRPLYLETFRRPSEARRVSSREVVAEPRGMFPLSDMNKIPTCTVLPRWRWSMDQNEDPRELERKIEQASRIASRINDPTTLERLREFVEELKRRLRQRLAARRAKEETRTRARQLWEQHGRPSDRDLEFWLQAEVEISERKPE